MATTTNKVLTVRAKLIQNGIAIKVLDKIYKAEYPRHIWQSTPQSIRQVLLDNLTLAYTHILPLILDKNKIKYDFTIPFLEPFFFKNQLYDLLDCERADQVKHLSYLKNFYNLEYEFKPGKSQLPNNKQIPRLPTEKPTAVLPFTFGKESLLSLGLCLELGIKPILVYCQELGHPYEEKYKLKKITKLKQEFKIDTYFIKNEPGLFRYGISFGLKNKTEIGWGAQTTILALAMVPFVFSYKAQYIIYGSEFSNNDYLWQKGWKSYVSFDQTGFWSREQDIMVKLLTANQVSVRNILEPLDQIVIFFIITNRYPQLMPYLFSCFAQKPLYRNSQWCHQCYKCEKIFTFSLALGIDPLEIGFEKDMTLGSNYLNEYFSGKENDLDLDFALYILTRKGFKGPFIDKFKRKKINKIKSWKWYVDYFNKIKNYENLLDYRQEKLLNIFREELRAFRKILPR